MTSAMSCEVRANSMLLMSSSCWSSFSSDQQDTNAALKRSLEAERSGKKMLEMSLVPLPGTTKSLTNLTPGITDFARTGQ